MIYDDKTKSYIEQQSSTVRITVYATHSKHSLVDMVSGKQGKFQFTAAETGNHLICLSPKASDWVNQKGKLYFDLQYYFHDEFKESPDEITSLFNLLGIGNALVDARYTVQMIRHFLQMQRDVEAEMRELSEKINTDTYRYTLLQIFVVSI